MRRREVLMGGAALAAGMCGALPVDAAKRTRDVKPWAPAEFPISFWCGPPEPHVTPEQYRRIRDAGFNYVMPPCSGATRETNLKSLDLAKATGLKVFVSDGRIPVTLSGGDAAKKGLEAVVADYGRHPALAGYFVADEPGAEAYPALGAVTAYLRQLDPAHPAYINIYPNYAPLSALNAVSYDAYVERYIEGVQPFVVSYDHYHFRTGGDGPLFFQNLESVRRVSQKHGVPFWQIVLTTQHFDYRKLTEPEQRWEAMQTLAYGGKGLMYFTYWTPDNSAMWGEGVIRWDGTPSYHYEHVRRINRDVQAIGRWLLPAFSRSVHQTGAIPPGGSPAPGDAPVRAVTPAQTTIGIFEDGPRSMALITSRDYRREQMADFQFNAGGKLERLDKATGRWVKAGSLTPAGIYLADLRLPPGDGELFRW